MNLLNANRILLLPSLLLALILGGCAPTSGTGSGDDATILGGTDTTNPKSGTQSAGIADELSKKMCEKVATCYSGIAVSACSEAVKKAKGIPSKLGDKESDFPTLEDVDTGASNQTLRINQTSLKRCHAELDQLPCSGRELGAAYNPKKPKDFSKFGALLVQTSGSCPNVIENKIR